ncbi:MAG: hypothetical protein Q8T08_05295 [Ignavibacteria bacterium]|nr:hypothetical protein [Ignavibacteria bacterium]
MDSVMLNISNTASNLGIDIFRKIRSSKSLSNTSSEYIPPLFGRPVDTYVIDNLSSTQNSLRIRSGEFNKTGLNFKNDFYISFVKHGEYFAADHLELGIVCTAKNLSELREQVIDDILFKWDTYVLSSENDLTGKAIELKKKLMSIFN